MDVAGNEPGNQFAIGSQYVIDITSLLGTAELINRPIKTEPVEEDSALCSERARQYPRID